MFNKIAKAIYVSSSILFQNVSDRVKYQQSVNIKKPWSFLISNQLFYGNLVFAVSSPIYVYTV